MQVTLVLANRFSGIEEKGFESMSESLPKTPVRFSVFLIVTNLSILLLLLFWLWNYWHNETITIDASGVDEFFKNKAQFLIFNQYVFESYTSDLVLTSVFSLIWLSCTVAISRKSAIAHILLAAESVLVLVICIFIQSKIDVLHLWTNAVSLAFGQNILSVYLISRQKGEIQNFNRAFLSGLQIIAILIFILSVYSQVLQS